ncbi:recombinase family protein [Chloroflexota bacterium]
MGKAAIYARVSTQEQADRKLSIETQIADCKKYSQQQNDTVTKTYVDLQSGQDIHSDREQFKQMLSDAKSGQCDKIVVWRPDRLFRGLTPAGKLARVLDETGVGIAGATQPVDRAMIGPWAWVDEMEIRTMAVRFRAGKKANARKYAKWPGGSIRYGYRYTNKHSGSHTGQLEINESEAKVILNIFQKIADGWTISKWVRYANAEGIPTKNPKSKGWTVQYTSVILRSREYIGEGPYDKDSSREAVSLNHPVIIPKKQFEKVQARLAHNRIRNKGASKNTYPLQHLGRRGVCGAGLGNMTYRRKFRYLYCMGQKNYPHSNSCFNPKAKNLTQIEHYIWE